MRELRSLLSGDDRLFGLAELASALQSKVEDGSGGDIPIRGVTVDSRATHPGDLFVALEGAESDGHGYLADARARGAVAALISSHSSVPVDPSFPVIRVDDTLFALGEAARWHRGRFDVPVVAVTGSVGKTTTKDMIAGVLSDLGPVLKNPGNFNTEIGTPLTLLGLGSGHRAAVMEIGMRKPGDVRYLARIIRPEVGVLTNVRESHLEFFGCVENLARSKGELFAALPAGGWSVINGDDPWGPSMAGTGAERTVYYHPEGPPSLDGSRRLWGEDVRLDGESRASFVLRDEGGLRLPVRLPLPGRHHVANALAAAGVGFALALDPGAVRRGLETFEATEMRSQWMRCGPVTILNDAYNSSPTSCAAALETLVGTQPEGRRVALLGPMLELGCQEVPGHRAMGRLVTELGIDTLITAGSPAELIGEEARSAGMDGANCRHFADLEAGIRDVPDLLCPGDIVLVKASRSCRFERFVDAICRAFDSEEGAPR